MRRQTHGPVLRGKLEILVPSPPIDCIKHVPRTRPSTATLLQYGTSTVFQTFQLTGVDSFASTVM